MASELDKLIAEQANDDTYRVAKAKPARKFIKERRRNACPACLDRNALSIVGQPTFESVPFGKCQVCEGRGYVYEVYPIGNEWRRYPWVIAE